jgi:hypothetical protein
MSDWNRVTAMIWRFGSDEDAVEARDLRYRRGWEGRSGEVSGRSGVRGKRDKFELRGKKE